MINGLVDARVQAVLKSKPNDTEHEMEDEADDSADYDGEDAAETAAEAKAQAFIKALSKNDYARPEKAEGAGKGAKPGNSRKKGQLKAQKGQKAKDG